MGLFDKIKDNARDISMRAIEATREYDEDYQPNPPAGTAVEPTPAQPDASVSEAGSPPAAEPAVDATPEVVAEQPEEIKKEEPKAEEKPKEEPRLSKITEVSKKEYEASKKSSKQSKGHQPPKVKVPYTPSYKQQPKADPEPEEAKPTEDKKPEPKKEVKAPRVIDVTPKKNLGPANPAFYARERAALAALASQRKMSGTVALYVTQHLNFKTRVFVDRIEYSGSFGKNVVPIEQVSWVKLRAGGTGVIIETVEGKRIVMVVKPADRLAFADAVLKVQAMQPKRTKFKDTKTVRIDELEKFGEGVDEIEKLAKLYDKGILSKEEFETKKKQILGI